MLETSNQRCLESQLARVEAYHERTAHQRSFEDIKAFARDVGLTRPAPQVVVVAGTNGKGSVCRYLETMLRQAEVRVGVTASPHMHIVNERIRLNGESIADGSFAACLGEILSNPKLPNATYFDLMTLAALRVFKQEWVDVAVIEIGLGGRLDAGNVVEPSATAITNIGLDHQDRLGPTCEHIGREKAGVLRKGVPTVFGSSNMPRSVRSRATELGLQPEVVATCSGTVHEKNLAVASKLFENVQQTVPDLNSVNPAAFNLPGRYELVQHRKSTVLLDVAHNVSAIRFLSAALRRDFSDKKVNTLFACFGDKDYRTMLSLLASSSDLLTVTRTEGRRGFAPPKRVLPTKAKFVADPVHALNFMLSHGRPDDLTVVCGSFQLVSRVREVLGLT